MGRTDMAYKDPFTSPQGISTHYPHYVSFFFNKATFKNFIKSCCINTYFYSCNSLNIFRTKITRLEELFLKYFHIENLK
jgi:hypothetical protein